MAEAITRRLLFRWMGWFALVNAMLLMLVDLRYLPGFTPGGTALSWVYLLLVFPAHHILLSVIPLFLILALPMFAVPSRSWANRIAIAFYALLMAVIVLDSLLWSQSRFHINILTLQILGWQSWLFVAGIFLIALFFESMLAQWVWRWVEMRPARGGRAVGILCAATMVLSNLIFAWADATYYVPVTSVGPQLPVYEGFTAKEFFTRLGMVDPSISRQRAITQRLSGQLVNSAGKILDYPLRPLQCQQDQPLNLLLILADAMRSDVLQASVSPYLWRMAHGEASWFTQHFSGGNSSRMGVFSLYYGLPPGYWSSFDSLQRSSVLIDELQRQKYQLGLFTSSTMYRPVSLDRTAFANVTDLRLNAEADDAPSWQRDQTMTNEWIHWLRQRNQHQPFFGFLFYDSTNTKSFPGAMDSVDDLPVRGSRVQPPNFSDYQKSVRYVDGLVESVMLDLEVQGLAENTVVIFTSDHGEEFDDSGLGFVGHGSAYTRYQLQVPLLVRWPGRPVQRIEYRTSHYDVVPTLMEDLLGCSNPPGDFAVGQNLFDGTGWDWLLVGSYYNYAVVEPDQLTITFPSGGYEVRGPDYRIVPEPHIRGQVIESALNDNRRFYRQ